MDNNKTISEFINEIETENQIEFQEKQNTVKLSTLPKDTIVFIEELEEVRTVEEIYSTLSDNRMDDFRNYTFYTTTKHYASFDADSIIDNIIEDEYNNGMYEDWIDNIHLDITEDDIRDLQVIFDRILARSPNQNIAYESDKLIEIDI